MPIAPARHPPVRVLRCSGGRLRRDEQRDWRARQYVLLGGVAVEQPPTPARQSGDEGRPLLAGEQRGGQRLLGRQKHDLRPIHLSGADRRRPDRGGRLVEPDDQLPPHLGDRRLGLTPPDLLALTHLLPADDLGAELRRRRQRSPWRRHPDLVKHRLRLSQVVGRLAIVALPKRHIGDLPGHAPDRQTVVGRLGGPQRCERARQRQRHRALAPVQQRLSTEHAPEPLWAVVGAKGGLRLG